MLKKFTNQQSGDQIILHKSNQVIQDSNQPNRQKDQTIEQQLQQISCTQKINNDLLKKIQIKRIVRRLVNKLKNRMFQSLKKQHYYLINDQSHPIVQKQEQVSGTTQSQQSQLAQKKIILSQYALFNSCILILKRKIPIFKPSSNFRLFWDFLMMFAISILFFLIPVQISFDLPINGFSVQFLYQISNVMIFFDIFINMNTAYYEKGIYINDRWKIVKHYLKTCILTELLGCFSLIVIYTDIYSKHVLIVFFLKINHFSNIAKRLQERFLLGVKARNIIQLIKLLLTIIIISHILANIWIYMAKQENLSNIESWLDYKQLSDAEWPIQYCQSYYYIIVTMCTVGYGDTAPINPQEQILCIFTMFIGCGVFGYSINMIGIILQDMYKQENEISKNMYVINNYMNNKQINKTLQYQIRKYLEYYYHEISKRDLETEAKIINQLPEALKQTLQIETNKMIIKDSLIFAPHFSEEVLLKTISLIKECHYTPEEIIQEQDQIDDNSIYFIEKGKVEIFIDQKQGKYNQKLQTIQILEQGQSFGSYNFFTQRPIQFSARSLEFTTLLKIQRDNFLELLKGHQLDNESFNNIRDALIFEERYDIIGLKCSACKSSVHTVDKCPFIHYIANKDKIIYNYNLTYNQERGKANRRQRKNQKQNNKFKNILKQTKNVEQFNEDNASFLDEYEEINKINKDIDFDEDNMDIEDLQQSEQDDNDSQDQIDNKIVVFNVSDPNQQQNQNSDPGKFDFSKINSQFIDVEKINSTPEKEPNDKDHYNNLLLLQQIQKGQMEQDNTQQSPKIKNRKLSNFSINSNQNEDDEKQDVVIEQMDGINSNKNQPKLSIKSRSQTRRSTIRLKVNLDLLKIQENKCQQSSLMNIQGTQQQSQSQQLKNFIKMHKTTSNRFSLTSQQIEQNRMIQFQQNIVKIFTEQIKQLKQDLTQNLNKQATSQTNQTSNSPPQQADNQKESNKQSYEEIIDFDQIKLFQLYKSHNNIDQILQLMYLDPQTYKVKINQQKKQSQLSHIQNFNFKKKTYIQTQQMNRLNSNQKQKVGSHHLMLNSSNQNIIDQQINTGSQKQFRRKVDSFAFNQKKQQSIIHSDLNQSFNGNLNQTKNSLLGPQNIQQLNNINNNDYSPAYVDLKVNDESLMDIQKTKKQSKFSLQVIDNDISIENIQLSAINDEITPNNDNIKEFQVQKNKSFKYLSNN